MSSDDTIRPGTSERVLAAMGFDEPPRPDAGGLSDLYRAWCARVPFDNVRKLIALAEGSSGPLPGDTAEDFFAGWLDNGTGGTCWPTANALHALLVSVGFESRRLAGSMWETGEPSHGTTVVTIDGDDHLVDSSMLTDAPVPLDRGHATSITHPVFATTAEPVGEGWRFEFPLAFADAVIPCRTISPDAVDHAYFSERYEVARTISPFNGHVCARRNQGDSMVALGGGVRYVRSPGGIDERTLDSESLRQSLVGEFGMSEEIVDLLLGTWTPPA